MLKIKQSKHEIFSNQNMKFSVNVTVHPPKSKYEIFSNCDDSSTKNQDYEIFSNQK
jgi:hypothetical protein